MTNTHPQQGFRLLELTPDLEELLASKDAPAYAKKTNPSPHPTPNTHGVQTQTQIALGGPRIRDRS